MRYGKAMKALLLVIVATLHVSKIIRLYALE